MPLTITFLGHAGFLFDDGQPGGRVCVDPFLTGNPKAKHQPADIVCDVIAFTHGHGDHLNDDGIAIAKTNDATCIANYEIANLLKQEHGFADDRVEAGNPGGSIDTAFGRVAFTPALHSSSGPDGRYLGVACGFVLHFERVGGSGPGGVTVYHAGDTALFSDMKLIGELGEPDVALLPAGGRYNMTPKLAARAAEMVGAKAAVPIHWGTFPHLGQDVDAFTPDGVDVKIMPPGDTWVYTG